MKKFRKSVLCQVITIILVAAFFWATMPISKSHATQPAAVQKPTPAAPAQGTIPGDNILVRPKFIIKNFPTGTPQITYEMEQMPDGLNDLLAYLETYPQTFVAPQGTVSKLTMYNGCYYDPDKPDFFSTKYGPVHLQEKDREVTNDLCQTQLGLARAWAVTYWLINHGIAKERIYILVHPMMSMKLGGNLPNQAVVPWLIKGAPIKDSEIPGTDGPTPSCGKPTVTCKVDSPCSCTTKENLVDGVWVINVVVTCPDKPEPATETKKHNVSPWLIGAGITAIALIVLCSIEVKGAKGPNGSGGDVRVCPFK